MANKNKIVGNPLSQQKWESDKWHALFLDFLAGLNQSDIAIKWELTPIYVRDIHTKARWLDRKHMAEALQENNAHHLTVPTEGIEVEEGFRDDTISSRLISADEVIGADYISTAKIHAQLVKHLEEAVSNVKVKGLSMTELKALASVVKDLQTAKHEMAKDILAIDELAAALQEVQRKRSKK